MEVDAAQNDHAGTASVLLGLSNSTPLSSTPPLQTVLPPNVHVDAQEQLRLPASTSSLVVAGSPAAIQEAGLQSRRRSQVSALPRKEWSADEDELIRDGVLRLGCRWRVIASQLPGRSDDAVRNRWSRLQDNMRHRNGEGEQRASGVGASGGAAASLGGASSKSAGKVNGQSGGRSHHGNGGSKASDGAATPAKNRNNNDGSISGSPRGNGTHGSSHSSVEKGKKERSSWTRAEDDIIIQGVAELGHKWYEIARRLPGRTDHAIRNRWSRLQSIIGQQDVHTLTESLSRSGAASTTPPAIAAATVANTQQSPVRAGALGGGISGTISGMISGGVSGNITGGISGASPTLVSPRLPPSQHCPSQLPPSQLHAQLPPSQPPHPPPQTSLLAGEPMMTQRYSEYIPAHQNQHHVALSVVTATAAPTTTTTTAFPPTITTATAATGPPIIRPAAMSTDMDTTDTLHTSYPMSTTDTSPARAVSILASAGGLGANGAAAANTANTNATTMNTTTMHHNTTNPHTTTTTTPAAAAAAAATAHAAPHGSSRLVPDDAIGLPRDALAGLPRDALAAEAAAATSRPLGLLRASPSAANLCLMLNGGHPGDTSPTSTEITQLSASSSHDGAVATISNELLALKRPRV